MDADLDTLATALYVRIDDTLADRPELRPRRPRIGISPKLSDAELLTLAVLQVLLGFRPRDSLSEQRTTQAASMPSAPRPVATARSLARRRTIRRALTPIARRSRPVSVG